MLKSALITFALVVGLVVHAVDEKVLELQALAMLTGGEQTAKKAHRTITRYRVYLDRVEAKLNRGVDEEKARRGSLYRQLHMSELAMSLPPQKRAVIWRLTHRTLDLEAYIASGGEPDRTTSDQRMDELVVLGSIFDQMPMDPAEFSVKDIRVMRSERKVANELYRSGRYDEAYPLLLNLAKRGFKDSQSRLAYVLFNGTENVEKSNLRALGWLGSAAYGDTEPNFRILFKRYMDEVPDDVRSTVDQIVNDYQQSFAFDDQQHCSTEHRYAYGIVKRTYCRFKLEAIAEACESGLGGGQCWAHAVNVTR